MVLRCRVTMARFLPQFPPRGPSSQGAQSKNRFSVCEAPQAAQEYEKRSQGVEQGRLLPEAVTWKGEPCEGAGRWRKRGIHVSPTTTEPSLLRANLWGGMVYLEIKGGSLSHSGHGDDRNLCDCQAALGQDAASNEQKGPGRLVELWGKFPHECNLTRRRETAIKLCCARARRKLSQHSSRSQ